jgi:hypothetical protein
LRIEQAVKRWAIADVELVESEVRVMLDLIQAPVLEAHVVGVVEVVHTDDGVAVGEQQLGDLGGDEFSDAGYEILGHLALRFLCPPR